MQPHEKDPKISEIVRRLVGFYRPERVYLFGSVARGDAGPDSDYDIMVVVADTTPRIVQCMMSLNGGGVSNAG